MPVESIAEDLLGLRIEERLLEWSGMLLPAERTIVLNAAESPRNDPPLRRHRFTIAHEIGHWVCHCLEGRAPSPRRRYCRATDIANDADRDDRARGEHLRERAADAGGGGACGVGEDRGHSRIGGGWSRLGWTCRRARWGGGCSILGSSGETGGVNLHRLTAN